MYANMNMGCHRECVVVVEPHSFVQKTIAKSADKKISPVKSVIIVNMMWSRSSSLAWQVIIVQAYNYKNVLTTVI